ncbi:MAG: NAD-dependent epimerase/dehydratase family protein [Candidatus Melainabacteria bacterium]|nr:NAD-dependent epimerase/dehydratase family protein [Candidatus Melainabacteria bacterium]
MKAFITGGAGFIGSTIADRLLQLTENEVTVLDNFCSGQMSFIEHNLNNKRFKLMKGDLLDLPSLKEAIKGHDFVFHFAANPDISKAMTETDLDLRLGILTTYNLLESMRINGIQKIVYSSGSGVYGDIGLTQAPETFGPTLPTSMYGASKLGSEAIISAFCNMFDMQSWIFRFANVVGARQTHGVGFDFIRKLKGNPKKLDILGDGKQSKSYVHVNDVIDAILFTVKNCNEMLNIFNVATDDSITVKEIADIVVSEMNLKNVKYEFSGGRKGWKGDIPVVRFSLTKIHNLGWRSKLSSKEAVLKSIREMLKKESKSVA